MRRLISFSCHTRGRHLFVAGLLFFSALLPASGHAAPIVVPLEFNEHSAVTAGTFQDFDIADNECAGVPVLCETVPTSASIAVGRTRASAATDGNGGSELGLASLDSNILAFARTVETGVFQASSDVEVRMQAFFPEIALFGVFSEPASSVSYEIEIRFNSPLVFSTRGVLTSDGFTVTGTDIGAFLDPFKPIVTVPPFLFDSVLGTTGPGSFSVEVLKILSFEGTNGVELAQASIVDPFGLLRNGLVFTAVGSVPEPDALLLLAGGLVAAYCASRWGKKGVVGVRLHQR